MKPDQARALRKHQEAVQEARGEALRRYLEGGESLDEVQPELIPTREDESDALRVVLKAVRAAERQPRGPARNRKLDQAIPALARLVFVERVLALDRLERAALTPRRLRALAQVGPEDLRRRLDGLTGNGGQGPALERLR